MTRMDTHCFTTWPNTAIPVVHEGSAHACWLTPDHTSDHQCANCGAIWPRQGKEDPMGQRSSGHGHVRPREDGVKARCGGPKTCAMCAHDLAEVNGLSLVSVPTPSDYELQPAMPAGQFRIGTVVRDQNGIEWRVESGGQMDSPSWKRVTNADRRR